ncbi:MAG: ABC transporter permease [Lachnospiraceae bacterium]|nr:ABC transporter permease [Lachnospiraceae bacterium]
MDIATLFSAMPGNVAQGIIWGIMALGVFMTFKLLNFADLTVDGSFATGGAVAVILITGGWSVPAALIMATLAGVLAGMATGILHTVFGIPDILAGILTQIALYSVNLNIMTGKANVAVSVDKYNLLVSLRFVPKTILVASIFAIALISLMYWYFGTSQGCAIRATGNNPAMSSAQGININLMKVITLALSNGVVALSGGLMAQYQGFADINMGRGAIVIGLAAVIIGEVLGHAIIGKRMNFIIRMLFVILGGIVYYIVIGIVLWLRMPTNDLKLFTAIIVAIFLAVPYLRGQARSSFRKAARKGGQK